MSTGIYFIACSSANFPSCAAALPPEPPFSTTTVTA